MIEALFDMIRNYVLQPATQMLVPGSFQPEVLYTLEVLVKMSLSDTFDTSS